MSWDMQILYQTYGDTVDLVCAYKRAIYGTAPFQVLSVCKADTYVSCPSNDRKRAWFCLKVGVASKNS
ncbi:MAG: hypothetical protein MJA29_07830, partial [Candidatus Omnitrophica bacterium]|nr:hypothetical protein [Candidatus Omnitrophota bacterium]